MLRSVLLASALSMPAAAQGVFSDISTGPDGTSGVAGVQALAVDADGQVYAGGRFTSIGGTPAANVARWDGQRWTALGAGIDYSAYGMVYGVAAAPSGRLAAITSQTDVLSWDGAEWRPIGDRQSVGLGELYSVAIWTDGAVYVGGRTGDESPGIVTWDGTAWSAVGAGLLGSIWSMTVGPDGRLYVGGEFVRRPGDRAPASVARWDGTAWEIIGATEQGSEVPVNALAFAPNGDLYAGGYFATMNGIAARNVARWNGTAWSAVGPSQNALDTVWALRVGPDGNLYAGGYASVLKPRLSQWDGTSWMVLGPFSATYGTVYGLATDRNGDVIVGGQFDGAGGVVSPGVIRYTPTAVAAEPPVNSTEALALAVSPNPARGAVTATVTHPAGRVTIELLDTRGRRVALVTDADAAAGTDTFALPLGGLAPGAYVVRVAAGREHLTRPLVVVR